MNRSFMNTPWFRGAVLISSSTVANLQGYAESRETAIEARLLEMERQMQVMRTEMDTLRAELQAEKASPTSTSKATAFPEEASAAPAQPTTSSKYPIRFYGKVKLDAIYDTNDLGSSEYITYVPQDADGQSQSTFTARETRLGIATGGPALGDWRTTAKIETDFYGSAPSSGSGSLRIRLAYVDLDSGSTSVRVGQDWIPISTLNPTSTNFTIMAYNGNLWGRVPQATFRQKFSGNVTGLLSAYRCRDEEDIEHGLSCDLTMPWLATGLQIQGDLFGTGDAIQFGVHGAVRNGDVEGRSVTPSLVSAEFKLPWHGFAFQGEAYYGQGLGAEYLHRGGAFNLAGDPIRTSGGFVQLGIRTAEPIRFHIGYGLNDPRDEDLTADEFYRKSTYFFGNAFCDIASDLSLVVEGTQVKTTWSDGTKDGFRIQSSLIFLW